MNTPFTILDEIDLKRAYETQIGFLRQLNKDLIFKKTDVSISEAAGIDAVIRLNDEAIARMIVRYEMI
jgi:hypothetical protein